MGSNRTNIFFAVILGLLAVSSEAIPLYFGDVRGRFLDQDMVEVSFTRERGRKIPLDAEKRKELLAKRAGPAAARKLQDFIENLLGSHRVPVITFQRELDIDFQMASHLSDSWGKDRYGQRELRRSYGVGENWDDLERIIGRYRANYHVELISSERTKATPYFLENFDLFIRDRNGRLVFGNTAPLTDKDLEAYRVPSEGSDYLEVTLSAQRIAEVRRALLEARVALSEVHAEFVISGPYVADKKQRGQTQMSFSFEGPSQMSLALSNEQLRHLLGMAGTYEVWRHRGQLMANWCRRILGFAPTGL